jgi:hypothetical protein
MYSYNVTTVTFPNYRGSMCRTSTVVLLVPVLKRYIRDVPVVPVVPTNQNLSNVSTHSTLTNQITVF